MNRRNLGDGLRVAILVGKPEVDHARGVGDDRMESPLRLIEGDGTKAGDMHADADCEGEGNPGRAGEGNGALFPSFVAGGHDRWTNIGAPSYWPGFA
jgi:hypothetical protein